MVVRSLILLFIIHFFSSCYDRPGDRNTPQPLERHNEKGKDKNKNEVDQQNTNVDIATKNLLEKQNAKFTSILNELKTNKAKVNHWIWWVFPTEQPGKNEDEPKTKVELSQVDYILENANMDMWSSILEEIYALLKSNPIGDWKESNNVPNANIILPEDHGRIGYALKFWLGTAQEKTKKNTRFFNALKNLDKFQW